MPYAATALPAIGNIYVNALKAADQTDPVLLHAIIRAVHKV